MSFENEKGKINMVETGVTVNGKEVMLPVKFKETIDNLLILNSEKEDVITKQEKIITSMYNLNLFAEMFENQYYKDTETKQAVINYVNNYPKLTNNNGNKAEELATTLSTHHIFGKGVDKCETDENGIMTLFMKKDCFTNNTNINEDFFAFFPQLKNMVSGENPNYSVIFLPFANTITQEYGHTPKNVLGSIKTISHRFGENIGKIGKDIDKSIIQEKSFFPSLFSEVLFEMRGNDKDTWDTFNNNLNDTGRIEKLKELLTQNIHGNKTNIGSNEVTQACTFLIQELQKFSKIHQNFDEKKEWEDWENIGAKVFLIPNKTA